MVTAEGDGDVSLTGSHLSRVCTHPLTHHTHVWAISMLADNLTVGKVKVCHVYEMPDPFLFPKVAVNVAFEGR